MRANHSAPMKSIEFRELYINDHQVRFHIRKFCKHFVEISNSVYIIRPLLQPFLNLSKQTRIVFDQHYLEQQIHHTHKN
ncbi:hypothetical protein D3C78_1162340 [compost metagenome]